MGSNSQKFNFEIKNGCVIYKDGSDIVLLDTGSQKTFGIANDPVQVFPKIHEFVDSSITMLKGMDIMSGSKVLINYLNGEIFVNGGAQIESPVAEYSISFAATLPIVQISVDGKICNMLLDTGACTSYLKEPIVSSGKSTGEIDDFYIGESQSFKVKLFEHCVETGGQSIPMNFAAPTNSINSALSQLHVDGIIGYEFFRNFKVLFDFQNQRLIVGT